MSAECDLQRTTVRVASDTRVGIAAILVSVDPSGTVPDISVESAIFPHIVALNTHPELPSPPKALPELALPPSPALSLARLITSALSASPPP
jgi:hypothetical protein